MKLIHHIKLFLHIWKGEVNMVDVYVALIVHKVRTIEQVPAHLRPQVLESLKKIGLDGNGDPLPTEPTA